MNYTAKIEMKTGRSRAGNTGAMRAESFSESFSKTFSKGVRTAMHLKSPSYLILLENWRNFEPETGRESPDSDPRLHSETAGTVRFGNLPHASASRSASKLLSGPILT